MTVLLQKVKIYNAGFQEKGHEKTNRFLINSFLFLILKTSPLLPRPLFPSPLGRGKEGWPKGRGDRVRSTEMPIKHFSLFPSCPNTPQMRLCPRLSNIGRSISNFYRSREVSRRLPRSRRLNVCDDDSRTYRGDDGRDGHTHDRRRTRFLQARRARNPANR